MTTDFIVPITRMEDRGAIWGKLESLALKTYPTYGTNGFYGTSVSVTIGDLFVAKSMIITDLSYSWSTETPWEITAGIQAPMYTNVSISFTVLGDKPSASNSSVYSINSVDNLLENMNQQGNNL